MIDKRAWFKQILEESTSPEVDALFDLTFPISDRIVELMNKKGMSKSQLAEAMGVRPSMVTEWVCGGHNFTLKTIAKLTLFFGEPIIEVVNTGGMEIAK